MATRQLSEKLLSGEVTGINLNGATADDAVPTKGEMDAADALKADITYVDAPEKLTFVPQDPNPAHAEGNLFYDDGRKALSYQCDVNGVTINLAQEIITRVFNDSGSTITNGQVVQGSGVDATTGLPTVSLAQANTLDDSIALGMATHNIPNGAIGIVTAFGAVNDVDTSLMVIGNPIYLSDTVPGGLTQVIPDIATVIGTPTIIDAATGSILVRLRSNVSLPIGVAILQGNAGTFDTTPTFQTITGYTTLNNKIIGADPAGGVVTAPLAGFYRVGFLCTVSFAGLSSTRQLEFRVLNQITAAEFTVIVPIARDIAQVTCSMSVPVEAAANDTFVMQIASPDTIGGVTFDAVGFSIESINLT